MANDNNTDNLHQIYLRDSGTGKPEDSEEYTQAVNRVKSLMMQSINDGRSEVDRQFIALYRNAGSKDRKKKIEKARDKWKESTRDRINPESFKDVERELYRSISYIFQEYPKIENHYEKDKGEGERHYHTRIPFSWFDEIKKEYRGREKSYQEAIIALSYIVFHYRIEKYRKYPIMRVKPNEIERVLGFTKNSADKAVRHLRKRGLIKVVIFKGLVPWYKEKDKTSGSYRFTIPMIGNIRKITYTTLSRAINTENLGFSGEDGSVARVFLKNVNDDT